MFCNYVGIVVDININIENMLNIYSLYKAKFAYNHNAITLSAEHSWNEPQVLRSHKAVMSQYTLRSWQ